MLKSGGGHRGLTGLICMANIQFLWRNYKIWGATGPLFPTPISSISLWIHLIVYTRKLLSDDWLHMETSGIMPLLHPDWDGHFIRQNTLVQNRLAVCAHAYI